MKPRTILLAVIALFAFVGSAKPASANNATFFTLRSQPGDFIGQGLTQTFTPSDGTFDVVVLFNGGVEVNFHTADFSSFWNLTFTPPNGQTLFREQYEGAQGAFFATTSPGLDVSGDHRGCNIITGRFFVSEISIAPDGTPLKLAVDFEQHCEGAVPALFGSVRFNSAVPVDTRVSVGNASALKGNIGTSDAHVIVSLSMPSAQAVTVQFKTVDESAIAGKDFVASSGNLTFPAGTIAQDITIPIIGDRLARGNKTFEVNLSGAQGAPFGDASANVRILDPNIPLTVLSMFGQPGDFISPGEFLLTTADAVFTTSINFEQGIHIGVNNNGNDWTLDFVGATQQTLTMGDFENAQEFPFQPLGTPGLNVDGPGRICTTLTGRFTVLEASYTASGDVSKFGADFEQHCNGVVPALFGSIRINSNLRQLSVSNAVIDRKRSKASFTVTLNPPSQNTVFVDFATADGTAVAGGDYIATSKTIMFAPGEMQHKIVVLLVENNEDNGPAKQFFGLLSAPSGAPIWIGQGSATLTSDHDD